MDVCAKFALKAIPEISRHSCRLGGGVKMMIGHQELLYYLKSILMNIETAVGEGNSRFHRKKRKKKPSTVQET